MKSLNLLIASALQLLVSCSGRVDETGLQDSAKPNIIYILADDLGYGDVSCYKPDSKIRTPGIDRLASQGMMFTDAHSPSLVCTPTRYGILTGRYVWKGILKRGVIEGNFAPILERDRQTVPDFLKANGYRTAVFGKWHLGMTFQDADGGPAPCDKQGIQSEIDFTRDVLDGPNQPGPGSL